MKKTRPRRPPRANRAVLVESLIQPFAERAAGAAVHRRAMRTLRDNTIADRRPARQRGRRSTDGKGSPA
jgi:hypothetical protein